MDSRELQSINTQVVPPNPITPHLTEPVKDVTDPLLPVRDRLLQFAGAETGNGLDPLPFTYERTDDRTKASIVEKRHIRMKINGKDTQPKTDEEIAESVKRDKENEQWYTSERWRKKGLPAEQFEMDVDGKPITIYNYNGEQKLNEDQLETFRATIQRYSSRFPQILDQLRWICIEDGGGTSIHGDTEDFPLNGMATTPWKLFHLTPRGADTQIPHRIAVANNLEGTVTHEFTHFIQDLFKEEWKGTDKWEWCYDHTDDWELLESQDKTRKVWTNKTTGARAPSGRFPAKPEEYVTHYALLEPEEDICESMVAYMYDPELLQRTSPQKFEILKSKDQASELVNAEIRGIPTSDIKLPEIKLETIYYFIDEE